MLVHWTIRIQQRPKVKHQYCGQRTFMLFELYQMHLPTRIKAFLDKYNLCSLME